MEVLTMLIKYLAAWIVGTAETQANNLMVFEELDKKPDGKYLRFIKDPEVPHFMMSLANEALAKNTANSA